VLEERKTRLMEEDSSKVKKEPAWEKEYDSLILGDGPKGTYSMDPKVSQVNNNVLVIAGTGGGKTKSVVEANLLHAFHQSMVVLLTKRRLLDQYGPLLKSRGYDVKVLDLVHPAQSDVGYDPMLHLRDDTDIIGLAKALVSASGCTSAKEPYWENSAADLFAAFIKLARLLYWDWARMDRVLKLIRKIDYPPALDEDDCASMSKLRTLNPVDQFVALRKKDPQMFMSWLQYSNNASNTKACIQSMLFSAVNGVLTEGIQQIMAMPKQLEFTDLVNRKTVLFVLTSPVNPALHPFANLMLGTLFKELFEYAESLPGGRVPVPLTAICDDFATGGQIPNFQQHISIFREKGISVMMLVQSLSQLESMYGPAASVTIQDNTDNIVYMGGNNLDTAEQMARRINKPMDEVLALPRGQIYLFRSGQKGLQLQRYQIFNDPLYKQKIAPLEAVNTR
jgi:type IV secretory pathway TraG/TraD family ATPase VirD4